MRGLSSGRARRLRPTPSAPKEIRALCGHQTLVNAQPKRLVIIGEGTHGVMMEKNRMQLFREVFLDEGAPRP